MLFPFSTESNGELQSLQCLGMKVLCCGFYKSVEIWFPKQKNGYNTIDQVTEKKGYTSSTGCIIYVVNSR